MTVIGYGQLLRIVACELPQDAIFGDYAGKTHILALIIPCQTQGRDGRETLASYTQTLQPLVMDLRDVKAVVGRVRTRQKWWILDQFDAAIPTFYEEEVNAELGTQDETGQGAAAQEDDWDDFEFGIFE